MKDSRTITHQLRTESREKDTIKLKYTIEERIIDSTNIGDKNKFKIDIQQIRYSGDSVFIEYKLFEKKNEVWILKQLFRMQKDGITSLGLNILDFDNDGLNDVAIRSAVAARGANEIKTLFIFNKNKGESVLIRNSSHFPNLLYNKELDCLDAWLVYGGSSTVFLKIEIDSLREFAGVDLFDGLRTIYEIDKNGKRIILKKEKINEQDIYIRYKNYNPLKVNEGFK